MASPTGFSRRRLLQVGGVTAAALAAGAALLMRGGRQVEGWLAGAHPVTLSLHELAVLAALCDRVCPAPGGSQPGPRVLRVAQRVDRELAFHPPGLRRDFKRALLVLEHGGLAHAELARFTARSPEAQDAYLTRMAVVGSQLERQVFQSLKLVAHFFYYCDERTWKAMHYDGPPLPRKRPEADSRLERGGEGSANG